VIGTDTDPDPECLVVNMYISAENYQKFIAKFSNRKTSKTRARDYIS